MAPSEPTAYKGAARLTHDILSESFIEHVLQLITISNLSVTFRSVLRADLWSPTSPITRSNPVKPLPLIWINQYEVTWSKNCPRAYQTDHCESR